MVQSGSSNKTQLILHEQRTCFEKKRVNVSKSAKRSLPLSQGSMFMKIDRNHGPVTHATCTPR
jgi:hypothetical protein